MDQTELCYLPATDLAALIRDREVSPTEVVDAEGIVNVRGVAATSRQRTGLNRIDTHRQDQYARRQPSHRTPTP